jgi:hypothetical protein
MTTILKIKMIIRLKEDKEEICKEIGDTLKRIGIIQDSIERNDWYAQIEELKEYFRDLSNGTITIEIPEVQLPIPENIMQPLLNHQDKPENVEVIREEQDTRELHDKERKKQKEKRVPHTNQKEKKIEKGKNKTKKQQEKKIEYNDTSSDEIDKLEESEEEVRNEKEPPYNLENE